MNQFNPFFMGNNSWALIILLIWVLFWKGCSLWIAAQNHQKVWFLLLLVINTAGILEIIYIFFVAKKKWSDVKEIFTKSSSPKKE